MGVVRSPRDSRNWSKRARSSGLRLSVQGRVRSFPVSSFSRGGACDLLPCRPTPLVVTVRFPVTGHLKVHHRGSLRWTKFVDHPHPQSTQIYE